MDPFPLLPGAGGAGGGVCSCDSAALSRRKIRKKEYGKALAKGRGRGLLLGKLSS